MGILEGTLAALGCYPVAKSWNKSVSGTCETEKWNTYVCYAVQGESGPKDLVDDDVHAVERPQVSSQSPTSY